MGSLGLRTGTGQNGHTSHNRSFLKTIYCEDHSNLHEMIPENAFWPGMGVFTGTGCSRSTTTRKTNQLPKTVERSRYESYDEFDSEYWSACFIVSCVMKELCVDLRMLYW